jgi:hypothetical protein
MDVAKAIFKGPETPPANSGIPFEPRNPRKFLNGRVFCPKEPSDEIQAVPSAQALTKFLVTPDDT